MHGITHPRINYPRIVIFFLFLLENGITNFGVTCFPTKPLDPKKKRRSDSNILYNNFFILLLSLQFFKFLFLLFIKKLLRMDVLHHLKQIQLQSYTHKEIKKTKKSSERIQKLHHIRAMICWSYVSPGPSRRLCWHSLNHLIIKNHSRRGCPTMNSLILFRTVTQSLIDLGYLYGYICTFSLFLFHKYMYK